MGGARPIPATSFDDNGELDEKHIFCSQCLEPESYEVRRAGAKTTAVPYLSSAQHMAQERMVHVSMMYWADGPSKMCASSRGGSKPCLCVVL